jgi:soluble lytic murein transglycosylase-like protein
MNTSEIQNLIVTTATAYGLDPRLALEVASVESGFNPNAVSSAGAVGIFQLEPSTQSDYGVTDPTDPTQNIYAGVQYLASLISQFGDVAAALGAFNWGPGNVANAVAQYASNWLAHAPAETRSYVAKIMAAVGSQYTVSAGTTATQTPGIESAIAPDSGATADGMSLNEWLWVAGAGLAILVLVKIFE